MPSERAKENKTLTATCASCGKSLSTEMLVGVAVGRGRDAHIAAVCQPCLDKGYKAES
jgi:hypothetical protein